MHFQKGAGPWLRDPKYWPPLGRAHLFDHACRGQVASNDRESDRIMRKRSSAMKRAREKMNDVDVRRGNEITGEISGTHESQLRTRSAAVNGKWSTKFIPSCCGVFHPFFLPIDSSLATIPSCKK